MKTAMVLSRASDAGAFRRAGSLGIVGLAALFAAACAPFGHPPERGQQKGKVACEVAGVRTFDPITYPGQEAPVGHEHTFAGSRTILRPSQQDDASRTELKGASTSCSNPDDTAAYWFPTVRRGDKPLEIRNVTAYYYSGSAERPRLAVPTEPFPPDLRLVAGRRDGSGTEHVFWDCGDNSNRKGKYGTPSEARCDLASPEPGVPRRHVALRVKFRFPDCWDGVLNDHRRSGASTADYADDGSVANHLAYSSPDGTCPEDHPRKLPTLALHVHFDYSGRGEDVTLSSGDFDTLHADFWNTWVQRGDDPDATRGGLDRFNARCVSNGGFEDGSPSRRVRRAGGEDRRLARLCGGVT